MDRIHAGSFQYIKQTQTAGTIIEQVIPANPGTKARVTSCVYDCGTTAHTLSFLKALAVGTLQSQPAVSATSLIVDTASLVAAYMGGDILSTNDRICYQYSDGTWEANTVSAINTTTGALTVTALSSIRRLLSGQRIYYMGIPGDTSQLLITAKASTLQYFQDPISGIAESGFDRVVTDVRYRRSGFGDPMIFNSNNATAAGILEQLSGYYAKQ